MKTLSRNGNGGGGRAPLEGEGGFLLVMVMVIMLVLSTIAASTLINSYLERSLAKNQNYASIALQAADGGLAAGMSYIRENASNPARVPGASPWADIPNFWPMTLTRTLASGGSYTVTMRFKRERREKCDLNADADCTDTGEVRYAAGTYDGDGDCNDSGEDSGYVDKEASDLGADLTRGTADDPANPPCPGDLVLYNKCNTGNDCFGFPEALFLNAGQGFPIIEIDSVGYFGTDPLRASSYREIAMDVARNRIDIQVEGAITARGPVTDGGSSYVDGHGFNIGGTAQDAACADLPSVTVDAGLTAPACDPDNDPDSVPGGNPKGLYGSAACTAVHNPAPPKRPLGTTPWGMMGITQAVFNTLFTVPNPVTNVITGTQANPTYVWQKGDVNLTGNQQGFGILVVHNENFDPDVFEVSDPSSPLYQTTNANYRPKADSSRTAAVEPDPALRYDPTWAPATLTMAGTITFTGVIIADQMVRVNGNATTIGALLSLGGININGNITGNWSAKYSCDAIDKALGGFGYGTKIAWHRLR